VLRYLVARMTQLPWSVAELGGALEWQKTLIRHFRSRYRARESRCLS
jgi:hypothetical protein